MGTVLKAGLSAEVHSVNKMINTKFVSIKAVGLSPPAVVWACGRDVDGGQSSRDRPCSQQPSAAEHLSKDGMGKVRDPHVNLRLFGFFNLNLWMTKQV